MTKLYQSELWLKYQYKTRKKTAKQIAIECQVAESTIYRQLVKFGLIK